MSFGDPVVVEFGIDCSVKTLVSNGCGFVAGLLQNNGKARVDVFIQFEPHVAGFNGMSTYRSLVISAA